MRRIAGHGTILISLALLLLAIACGGGSGGNTSGGSANPTIISVSVSCSPSSIQVNQTSTCSATVAGTGDFSSAVNWTASSGSINKVGNYTAPGTPTTATIAATSVQDPGQSGNAQITVTKPNPVPFIDPPLTPMTAAPGGSSFNLTVNGAGFVSGAVVEWNGDPLTTTFVNKYRVTASVAATDIAKATTASVTVLNPKPGGGTSNVEFFTVSEFVSAPNFTVDAPNFGDVVPTGDGIAVDLNGDGKLDWVGTGGSLTCCELLVLLGNGDGSFRPPTAYPVPGGGFSFVVGDFNGDGKLDLAVLTSNLQPQELLVFFGKGDGTFGSPTTFATVVNFLGGVGDFNGDGNLDLLAGINTANGFQVSVLLGNGDGTFQAPVNYAVGPPLTGGIVVGDFNGDGILDIVCTTQSNTGSAQISVLLGIGDGTFASVSQIPMTFGALGLIAADFNEDGKLDLVTTVDSQTGAISVFLGNGDGTFQDGTVYLTGGEFDSELISGDFNSDGKLDLVVTNALSYFTVLFGTGDGTFTNGIVYSGSRVSPVATGDFNGDGTLDLAGPGPSALALLLQVNSGGASRTMQSMPISTGKR